MTEALIRGVASLIPVLVSLFSMRGIYHLFQLESYQFPGYFRSMRRNPVQVWTPGILSALVSLAMTAILWRLRTVGNRTVASVILLAAFLLLAAVAGILIARMLRVKKPKKPFVITQRVKRLYGVTLIVLAVMSYLLSHTGNLMIASAVASAAAAACGCLRVYCLGSGKGH